MKKHDKLSIFISLVLRHKPDAANITLDEHGWANVEELLNGINDTGRKINMEILEEIVATDNKQRYSFNQDKTLIRANQGHSIPVDVELKEQEPPEFLYHGTATAYNHIVSFCSVLIYSFVNFPSHFLQCYIACVLEALILFHIIPYTHVLH